MSTTTASTPAATKTGQLGRRRLRAEGRKKRAQKLKTDAAFAKTFFAAKSTRSVGKKSAFRKKKSKKK